MSAKTAAEVFVQPKNRRPYSTPCSVNYANRAELRQQITAYARTLWHGAKRVDVDTNTREIIIDGTAVANYALHTPGQPAPDAVVPTKPINVRRRLGRVYRHTAAQLAVVAAGLALTVAAGACLNGAWLAGFALAGFGLYRLSLGVQRREAAQR